MEGINLFAVLSDDNDISEDTMQQVISSKTKTDDKNVLANDKKKSAREVTNSVNIKDKYITPKKSTEHKRILCLNVIRKKECDYGDSCTFAHSLEDQNIDLDKRSIISLIKGNSDLSNIDLIQDNTLFKNLNKLSDKCVKVLCPGGYNCQYGACVPDIQICKKDLIDGYCDGDGDGNICKLIHLTSRGLVPYNIQLSYYQNYKTGSSRVAGLSRVTKFDETRKYTNVDNMDLNNNLNFSNQNITPLMDTSLELPLMGCSKDLEDVNNINNVKETDEIRPLEKKMKIDNSSVWNKNPLALFNNLEVKKIITNNLDKKSLESADILKEAQSNDFISSQRKLPALPKGNLLTMSYLNKIHRRKNPPKIEDLSNEENICNDYESEPDDYEEDITFCENSDDENTIKDEMTEHVINTFSSVTEHIKSTLEECKNLDKENMEITENDINKLQITNS